jgi:hypothetical protein
VTCPKCGGAARRREGIRRVSARRCGTGVAVACTVGRAPDKDGSRPRKESARPLEARSVFAKWPPGALWRGEAVRGSTSSSLEERNCVCGNGRLVRVCSSTRRRKPDPRRGSWGSSTIFYSPLPFRDPPTPRPGSNAQVPGARRCRRLRKALGEDAMSSCVAAYNRALEMVEDGNAELRCSPWLVPLWT